MPDTPGEKFQAVFDRHFGEVYGYVAYRLAPDHAAAQDVTQEVFLAAWQAWDSYRGEGTVLTWLRSIARRKVADHLRAIMQRRDAAEAGDLMDLADSDPPRPNGQLLLLAEVMRRLPPECVELLEEKYLEGLTVREMAENRSGTEKSIESALSRARDLLRSAFQRLRSREEMPDGNLQL